MLPLHPSSPTGASGAEGDLDEFSSAIGKDWQKKAKDRGTWKSLVDVCPYMGG